MSSPIRPATTRTSSPGFYGSTGWGDAICVIPLALYDHYADRAIVEEALPAMAKWNDFVWSISDGPIVRPPKEWGARGFTFGDWLQPVGGKWPREKPFRTIGDDASATIYLYISSALTAPSRPHRRRHGARRPHGRPRRRP